MEYTVIASYPKRSSLHSQHTVGGASYTKSVLENITRRHKDIRFTVLAEIFDKKEVYTESGIGVERVWKRNSIRTLFILFNRVLRNKHPVFVSLEAYMFGNELYLSIMVFLLLIVSLTGKNIIIMNHQTVSDFRVVTNNSFNSFILNFINKLYLGILLFLSKKIIVLEKAFKQYISDDSKKIIPIPHFVYQPDPVTKNSARSSLSLESNSFYILYFGFLSPYKGLDWLVDAWNLHSPAKLIIAGGINPNYTNDKFYVKYADQIREKAKQKGILVTGFVTEELIPLYFSSVDAVILPYKSFFSSSGPLSLTFAYHKPVLLSESLQNYVLSNDFSRNMALANLDKQDLFFNFRPDELGKKIGHVKKHAAKFAHFSYLMSVSRKIDNVCDKIYNELISV